MQTPLPIPTGDIGNFIPPILKNLFIFTPKNVPEGMEHEKILFFYPNEIPVEQKTKHIGLAEAMVNFTGKFSTNQPCEIVHFEKHVSAYYSPEPEHWIIMTVANPAVQKVKDGKNIIEYKENELDDLAISTALKQSYGMFKLFNGAFEYLKTKFSENHLKTKLDQFFTQYISLLNVDQIDLFNTLDGIQFLPVDKNVYLKIQSFVNLIENAYPKVKHTIIIYRDHLVWSGLEQDDTRVFFRFVNQYLLQYLFGEDQNYTVPFITVNNTREDYVTGPASKKPEGSQSNGNNSGYYINMPDIFVGNKNEHFKLVTFQKQEAMCFFLMEDSTSNMDSMFNTLGPFVSQQIKLLAPILDENHTKKQGTEDQYKYIYFNHMNFALKTSIKEKGAGISRDVMKMLNEIHADFEKSPESISEVLIRTQSDRWVVGRKSDSREFYVIFDNKNSHLIEINEEVKKLSSTYFNNIFID